MIRSVIMQWLKGDDFLRNALIFSSLHLFMSVEIISSQDDSARSTRATISKLIEECNSELDIDKKIQLFYRINSILPKQYQLCIPSLITDDYIDTVLYRIQQNRQIDT
jgi:predicted DNA-binding protein (UPF0278 family)